MTSPSQMPQMLEQAVNAAYEHSGVAVLTLPGDVGIVRGRRGSAAARSSRPPRARGARGLAARGRGEARSRRSTVTMLVGTAPRRAREQVLAVADRLSAPMVLTIKAKAVLERDNDFQVGQAGLLGNPAAATDALRSATCC